MLINDLTDFKPSYTCTTLGIDSLEYCIAGPSWWLNKSNQTFTYNFNSWGFRGPEYTEFIGKKVNICLGDSFTVNVGGPINHSWVSQLADYSDIPTLNLGVDGIGNDGIRLVFDRACEVFDVQRTFVMYSFLHRRLQKKDFVQEVHSVDENIDYFKKNRIPGAWECAVPFWCWMEEELQALKDLGVWIYNPPVNHLVCEHFLDTDRELYTDKKSYNTVRGDSWPTYAQYIGGQTHSDIREECGNFTKRSLLFANRDGFHMNKQTNNEYSNYLISIAV